VTGVDFDGSVQSTTGHAEDTAVGFNKNKKGARSHYPLFCTIAQTDRFLDLHHRSGNVHDSNGAPDFIKQCFERLRERVPAAQFESWKDRCSSTSRDAERATNCSPLPVYSRIVYPESFKWLQTHHNEEPAESVPLVGVS
jgi:hypothetical protein